MRRAAVAAVLVAWVAAGCTEAEPERRTLYPTGGPYVVTAIDYHFHDAHPSLPIPTGRPLEFSNQGRNPHNVTIPGFGVDRTFQPGERFSFDPVGSLFPEPGRYPFFCKLHRDRGMSGVIVVAEG